METIIVRKMEKNSKQFKSYYVVWKPFFWKKKDNQKKRLNRTMQYGNFFPTSDEKKNRLCLNRTMQYGNPGILPPIQVQIKV